MASSSSSSSAPRTWRYKVFMSFHGPDVRKTFLSHLRKQFSCNGISMFDDQRIERSQKIAPELTQGIRESRISIVVLTKNYASSSWCLNELVEILKCREARGQIVMTVFSGVDPSHVRKQSGDFGKVFKKTCAGKTKEERRSWSQALNDVGNIAGEHFPNWDDEAKMIEKIAKDVLDKLNATPSRDFDDMVGLKDHLMEMMDLLDLDYDGVKVVAISGPAGIGKTTIARALYSRLLNRFQLSCFVDNLRVSYHNGLDEYGLKLRLQEQFLSKILNHDGMRIGHLGAVKDHLSDQKVLIILDDVNNLNQLEALANETWFGPGSRIVVTTENKELLQQHGVDNTYHVSFPFDEEALEILCRYAFIQNYPHDGFEKLAKRVTELCGNLPLGLRVVGSSLRGQTEDDWEDVLNRLENILDHREIEEVLRVGYESLHENEQILFLHIAVFFNRKDSDLVKAMFADGTFSDVKRGLKILVNRSLIEMDTDGKTIEMHKLLQQMAREVIRKQEPWKRQILMNAHEICDVFENETDTSAVSGILFDISGISEVIVSKRAFKKMSNLRFLKIYKGRDDGNDIMLIPAEMELPRRLRLLDWEAYPNKCLPPTFHPEYLVNLCMRGSNLEYLWQGTQPLSNLKELDLSWSFHLKEVPDLSNATNLEKLNLSHCDSLVEIPSSFSHLQKLKKFRMRFCENLQVIPLHLNLGSLEEIDMNGCSKLRNVSIVSTDLVTVDILPAIKRWLPLYMHKSGKVEGLTHLPTSLRYLFLSFTDIESIPDGIKALHQLKILSLCGCRRLASLPELPGSLLILDAENCESLETVFSPLNHSSGAKLRFTNCFKLDQQSRGEIIQRSSSCKEAYLPGREVPAKFDHRGRKNSLTINMTPDGNNPFSAFSTLKLCVVLSPNHPISEYGSYVELKVLCRIGNGDLDPVNDVIYMSTISEFLAEHIFIFNSHYMDLSQVSREIALEFSLAEPNIFDIIECGAYIWTDETIKERYASELDQVIEEDHDIISTEDGDDVISIEDDTKCEDRTNVVSCESKEEEKVQGRYIGSYHQLSFPAFVIISALFILFLCLLYSQC